MRVAVNSYGDLVRMTNKAGRPETYFWSKIDECGIYVRMPTGEWLWWADTDRIPARFDEDFPNAVRLSGPLSFRGV